MENNVHRDVYNANVCKGHGRGGARGKRREDEERKKKIGMGQRWGEERRPRGRRESKRREKEGKRGITIRERKRRKKGEGGKHR